MATINNNVMTFNGPIQMKRGTAAALSESDYVPAAGEIIIATDTGRIKAGNGNDTWNDLPAYDETVIANSYSENVAGKALDAVKGKDLNDRLAAFEGMTSIDCGEITVQGSGD